MLVNDRISLRLKEVRPARCIRKKDMHPSNTHLSEVVPNASESIPTRFWGHSNPSRVSPVQERKLTKELQFMWRGSESQGDRSTLFTHTLDSWYWLPGGYNWDLGDPAITPENIVYAHDGA